MNKSSTPTTARGDMPLLAHIGELRRRLIISLAAVGAASIVGFLLWDQILELATGPYCRAQEERNIVGINGASACQLYISNPLALLTTRLAVAGYVGIFLASPVILWQLWRFVTPGLNKSEKRYAIPFVTFSVLLFALGAFVAWSAFPRAIEFFLELGGDQITTIFDPAPYLRMIFLMMLVFGIAFEIPILLVFLQLARVVSSAKLRSLRRYAIVGNFVVAAVGSPTQDPYTLLILAIPMCILYEVAIIIGRLMHR